MVLFPKIAELKAKAKTQLEGHYGTLLGYEMVIVLALMLAITAATTVLGLVFFWGMHFPAIEFLVGLLVFAVVIVLAGPILFSFARIYLRLSDGIKPVWKDMLEGFKILWRAAWAFFLMFAFTLLWFLAFAVPAVIMFVLGGLIATGGLFAGSQLMGNLAGVLTTFFSMIGAVLYIAALTVAIVKMYSYWMTMHVLADNPNLTGMQAFKESQRIMDGNKSKLFGVELSFMGWIGASIVPILLGMVFFVQATVSLAFGGVPDIGPLMIGMILMMIGGAVAIFVFPYLEMTIVNFYKDIKNKPVEAAAPTVAAE